MEKTLQIVIGLAIIAMVAVSVGFIFSDRAGFFGGVVENQTKGASCGIGKVDYENACECEGDTSEGEEAGRIKDAPKYDSCDWTEEYSCEQDVC